jgi:Pentapeptide repeats (8 copies)
VDLLRKDLLRKNLQNINFSKANLCRINLRNTSLTAADFSNANLQGAIQKVKWRPTKRGQENLVDNPPNRLTDRLLTLTAIK